MDDHSHSFTNWPFKDPDNVAAICCVHVLDRLRPILRVTHDDDGDWQFLCGQPHETKDGRVVCLGCMVNRDAALLALADLPLGWCADRDEVDAPWIRELNPSVEDEHSDHDV